MLKLCKKDSMKTRLTSNCKQLLMKSWITHIIRIQLGIMTGINGTQTLYIPEKISNGHIMIFIYLSVIKIISDLIIGYRWLSKLAIATLIIIENHNTLRWIWILIGKNMRMRPNKSILMLSFKVLDSMLFDCSKRRISLTSSKQIIKLSPKSSYNHTQTYCQSQHSH